MALNPRQQKFVERYLLTGNATQSYIDAGFTKNRASAASGADKLLRNAEICAALSAASDKGKQSAAVTAEWWFAGLKKEAEYTGEGAQHGARIKAYELLGKRLFPDEAPPPDEKGKVPVELVTGLLAALGARRAHPGGGGGAAGATDAGDAVVPEPGAAEPRVPE